MWPSATISPSPTCRSVLAQQGIDYASYREEMRQQLTLGLLRQRDVLQRIVVTPREIDQFLTKQAKAPATNRDTTFRTS